MGKILVLVGAGAMALGGLTACQPRVECGTVVTRNTKLTVDVIGCTGDALVIGADNITLDLAGHTVSSTDGIGIRLAGHDHVNLKRGTVRGGTTGLSVTDSRRLALREVDAYGTDLGVRLERVTDSTISRSLASGHDGFRLVDSRRIRIDRSTAPGNEGTGLRLEGSHHNRITRSTVTGGGNDSAVLVDSDYNTIVGNDLANSNTTGIGLGRSDHNIVRQNFVGAEAVAIVVAFSADNRIDGNWGTGSFGGGPGTGIRVEGADRTTVSGNALGFIRVMASTRTALTGNALFPPYDLGDGIIVEAGSTGSVLDGNIVTGFSDDGIDVRAPGTVLTGNVTNDNADFGIEAVPGVIDGGGNRASGNANPAQCLNVVCS